MNSLISYWQTVQFYMNKVKNILDVAFPWVIYFKR